jgi:FMN-dependent NADH-azoreductase
MARLLHLDTSVRKNSSNSRQLAQLFVKQWLSVNSAAVAYRDIGQFPPPHPTEAFTIANYTSSESRTPEMQEILRLSDELIQELLDVDHFVLSIPMYNFSVPSGFKAYIDNLIRNGKTFSVTEDGQFKGLALGKKVLVISTRGAAYAPPSPISQCDFQEPYLRTVFGFIGITDMTFVCAENLDFGTSTEKQESLRQAQMRLEELAKIW